MFRKIWLLLFSLLLFLSEASSQESFILHIHTDKDDIELRDLVNDKAFKDSSAVIKGLNSALTSLRFKGYLLAEPDTLIWKGNHLSVLIKLGKRFFLAALKNGNVESRFLESAGFKQRIPQNKHFRQDELEQFFKRLLQAYESHGYPFASISLDSIQIRDSLIYASLYANPGRFIQMDSIHTAGNASISPQFLQAYLEIKQHSPYNEELIMSVDDRLYKLPFIEVVKPSQINFTDDKAGLTLFLNKENANRFDGILGLLPDDKSGKLMLTGNITLQLQNAFRHAEQLGFNFKNFSGQSRELDLHFSVPFIFSSPIGIGADFNIYKQDTSFQNISFRGTAGYAVSAEKKLGFYIESRNGNVFKDAIISDKNYAALSAALYGLTYHYKKLDNETAPLRGLILSFDGSAGFKKVSHSAGGRTKSSQYRLETLVDYFLPAGSRSVFRLENQSALLLGKKLYDNELYRIGGFGLLRGFNEKSIPASGYSVFNAEYRYMIEQQSFLFIFCNQGLVQRKTINISETDAPLGFGAGINLKTKAGILSVSYALGKQKNIPVNLRQGKIHFGLIALF